MAKKKGSIGGKILFWLFIGCWIYPCKWVLIDIPIWCIKKILPQIKSRMNSSHAQTEHTMSIDNEPKNQTIKLNQPVVPEKIEKLNQEHPSLSENIAPVPQKVEKITKEWTFEEAVDVYVCTGHYSCKSIYDYHSYFEDAFECILQGLKEYPIVLSEEKVLRQKEILNPIDDTKNITKATNVRKLRNFIAIDTETTGLKTGGNDIIEISAIKFVNFRPVEIFHTYLKPRNPIPASATKINHISDDMVKDAPTFSQIKQSLQKFIDGFLLVAHNAPFDMKFLHVSGLNLEQHQGKVYDTLRLARLKIRDYDGEKLDSYKLEDMCAEQNIGCTDFHSSSSDALACGILFIDLIKMVREVDNVHDL
jgi:DNA polymerase III epsilon subunit family exonuclease